MTPPPTALILDFGGVISRTMFETHDVTERALGLPPGTLTWRGPFDPGMDALWATMQAGAISERDYWLTRTRETGALIGERWERMEEFVKRARGADPAAVIRPEADRAIRLAKAQGLKLGILSNELDLFYGAEMRQTLPLLNLFDTIVDATHTRILKPDARAYAQVAHELGVTAAQSVFVDDQARNVDGAIAAGMIAVAFDVRAPAKSYAQALAHFGLEMPAP